MRGMLYFRGWDMAERLDLWAVEPWHHFALAKMV